MSRKKIAIIGGGLSGLATATHLRLRAKETDSEIDVTVLEASDRVGGVIHTERVNVDGVGEFVIDHGADMFATQPPAAIELCRRLSADDRLLRPNPDGRGAMIARGKGLIPIPEGFVLMRPTKLMSMMTTPLLSPAGKLRLLRERFVPRRDGSIKDESVGEFVSRRLGKECLDRIVAPLVAGIYTADVYRLSMAATMGPIWEMESRDGSLARATLRRIREGQDTTERGSSGARYEQFRGFPNGMIGLIEMMTEAIGHENVRTGTHVGSLCRNANGIQVNDGETYDHVVLTTPAKRTASLLKSLQPSAHTERESAAIDEVNEALLSIRYASTAIVVMAVPRQRIERMPKTFGFVVPPSERRRILAGSFASEKFPGRAPDSFVIVRAFVGGVLDPGILQHSDDEIVEIVSRELADLIGLDSSRPLKEFAALIKVVRWNDAMPQYEVGHLEKVDTINNAASKISGIDLMTNALGGVGISPVIGAANRVSDRILAGDDVNGR